MNPAPHHVDVSVGRAVRAERKARGFSQERLATAIGVSFQQLQKYERGSNRISASKLVDIARTLEVAPTAFFHEVNKEELPGAPLDLAYDAEVDQLARRIRRLEPDRRRLVTDLLRALEAAVAT
ncbi:MAG: helix-turn-helix transcriptional regulator [Caulobacteraceae bacterium]|nr:helix-turn-helix transcriptional regulator [Caulobacter sp.]